VERATRTSGATFDMAQTGRRVLDSVRRELRSSGSNRAETLQLEVSPGSRRQRGHHLDLSASPGPEDTLDAANGWSTPITYRRVSDGAFPDGSPRYGLTRE
jgi:hypothetical protein